VATVPQRRDVRVRDRPGDGVGPCRHKTMPSLRVLTCSPTSTNRVLIQCLARFEVRAARAFRSPTRLLGGLRAAGFGGTVWLAHRTHSVIHIKAIAPIKARAPASNL